MQLHNIRKEHNLDEDKYVDLNPVEDSMKSEEAKLNCEN